MSQFKVAPHWPGSKCVSLESLCKPYINILTEYNGTAYNCMVHKVTSPIAELSITVSKYTNSRFAQRKTSDMLKQVVSAIGTISFHVCLHT